MKNHICSDYNEFIIINVKGLNLKYNSVKLIKKIEIHYGNEIVSCYYI